MEAKASTASMAATPALQASKLDEQENEDDLVAKSPFHARLTAFFWAHDPRRVAKVDELLAQHKDREEELLQSVHREFGVRDFSGETAVDDIYEHQRYSYLSFSWGSSFPGHLLPTDRRRWSGLHGAPSAQTRAKVEPQLPVSWRWTSDWEVDKETTNCDGDGWIYAFDMTNFNFMVKRNGGRKEPKATDYVRRRRWIRRRERIPETPAPVVAEVDPATEENEEGANNNNDVEEDDLRIPDSLDVDDDEGEDAGDDDDEELSARDEEDNGVGVFPTEQPLDSGDIKPPVPPRKAPATLKTPPSLESFSMAMEKPAIDAAWNMAVKNLESIYTEAKSHKTLKKKRWTVKKEKIQQQIHLLEKTIASMQSFIHEEHLTRRHSSSNLHASSTTKGLPKTNTKFPLSPDAKSSYVPNGGGHTSSRVSSSDTHGINLAAKLKCAQSKLDALKRMFWHPREKDYTLRFSIDGIFYGLRDFLVESFKGSYSFSMSHQSNGAQGITPTCKVVIKGHTVCCGKHVKVIGEKGTIVPKSLWDMMYLDTDFELTAFLIYVDDVEKERNPWLADKPTGSWEFLMSPESTRVELSNFTRRTRGGLDLPEPVVRKLMSDVLSTLVRDIVLIYFPQELALAFDAPPAKLDMEGDISITGPSIDHVMEREMELTSGEVVVKPQPSPTTSTPSPPGGSSRGVSPTAKPEQPLSPTFAAVAAVASATVNLLIGSDTVECMRQIAELLELTPAQLNLLVAVRQCGLYPSPYSFRSVTSICDYYRAFFSNKEQEDGGAHHVSQLRATWKQLLELVYIRKTKAIATTAKAPMHKYELFDVDAFFDRVGQLTRKPAKGEITMTRFNCTVNAVSVVDAMAQMFERVVLGIDYSKPRVENDRLIYGFRFGRKPKVSTAAAAAAHAQSSQLLDPTIHLQMDASFKSRLKAFSKFCRALKGGIELIKVNLDRLSLEVAGNIHGTGTDCAIHGSFRDMDFAGPVSLTLHVPALFLGIYRVQTVPLGGDRIGLQVELLLPLPTTTSSKLKKTPPKPTKKDDRVLLRAMLTDFSMDVLLDVDALIAQHHNRSMSEAIERVAPWSPTAAYAKQVEAEKTNEKHPALSISVQSTTGVTCYDDNENVIRIPSPTSNPNAAYGKVRVASSEFTKLHVKAKTGSFATNVMPLLKLLLRSVRPFFLESFPEHQVLFDRLHSCVMKWLCAKELQVDFDFLVKSFLHHKPSDPSNEMLFFTVCGAPGHPTPVVYRDELNLLDVILQGDDLINIWIDDKYPPYSNPLYF